MEGVTPIDEVKVGDHKYTMLKASLANAIIKRHNQGWVVTMPDARMGSATVRGSTDGDITIDLSTLQTIEFVVCNDAGTQFTVRCLGFML